MISTYIYNFKMKTETYLTVRHIFLLVLCIYVRGVSGQNALSDQLCEVKLPDNSTIYQACTSQPLDMLQNARFTLSLDPPSSTCGTPKQTYCTLGLQHCYICDATNNSRKHPPEFMYDAEIEDDGIPPTWWQSKAWDQYNFSNNMIINITFSFGKMYYLEGNIKITFQSARPIRMILEKSVDNGATWEVMQYYDKDCERMYKVGVPRFATVQNPSAVICSEEYSSIYPYTNGVVEFDLEKSRFDLFRNNKSNDLHYQRWHEALDNPKMVSFLSYTDLRIRLRYPGTDGKEYSENVEDLRKYYYAISDVEIIGGCYCNLHGRFCETNAKNDIVCRCEHNTEGTSCERCKPLYNNKSWKKGSYLPYPVGTANECEKCNCNDHASSCTYSSVVGRGVCDNCTHNTTGSNCEKCAPGHFRNTLQPLNHPKVCLDCNCEMLGVLNNNTNCSPVTGQGTVNGQCQCKSRVIGYRCDRCVDQYYGLLQKNNVPGFCKSCDCNLDGTVARSNVCEQTIGQCPCKPNTAGRSCNQCKDGFFNYPTGQSFRDCEPCKCDRGGSLTLACHKTTGICTCRPNVIGIKCTQTASGYYAAEIDSIKLEPAVSTISGATTCKITSDLQTRFNPFSGREFASCQNGHKVMFQVLNGNIKQPQLTWKYRPALRYSLNESYPWSSLQLQIGIVGHADIDVAYYTARNNGTTFDTKCPIKPGDLAQSDAITNLEPGLGLSWQSGASFTLDVRCQYSAVLDVNSGANSTSTLLVDSVVLVPDSNNLFAFQEASNTTLAAYNACMKKILAQSTKAQALTDTTCSRLIFEVGTQMTNGGLKCSCNAVGTILNSVCNVYGGQCQCKPGVTGLQCDRCAPGFYNFTSSGCTACNCNVLGSEILVCNYTTGQCPCRPNVARLGENSTISASSGLQCKACRPNHFGFYTGNGCQPCNCNLDGSNGTQCTDQGQCPCKPTINGAKCNQCQEGNFKFSTSGCVKCNCTRAGSVNAGCGQDNGVCVCKKNVQGDKCDQCRPGTFNLDTRNPDGCQPCYCYGHSTSCSSARGFMKQLITANQAQVASWQSPLGLPPYALAPAEFLGNKMSSYAQTLSVTYKSKSGGGPVVITGSNIVFLEGSNGDVYFYPVSQPGVLMSAAAPRQVDLFLHEKFWVIYSPTQTTAQNPTAFQFYTLLSNLKSIRVQRIFSGVQTDIVSVTLTTAKPAPPTVPVSQHINFVENCTCIATRGVTGLSCEVCAQGQKRTTVNGTKFITCNPCNCNKHALTIPPLCDANTGECLNCRNGTLGFNCERCAPNVNAASDCTRCIDQFWGLTKDGCQPCSCDPTGTVNPVCDQKTGQCTCAPNVAGRTCNMCADNHYDLQRTIGCKVCDACYALVTAEMNVLREILANITTTTAQLSANDKNSELGSFSSRLSSALSTMGSLIKFLSDATNVESAVANEIKTLNGTLQTLTNRLSLDASTTIIQANSSVILSRDRVSQSLAFIADAGVTVKEAWLAISGPVQQHLNQMRELATNIKNTLNTFNNRSSSALKDFFRQMNAVDSILNKTREVTLRTVAVLKLANEAQIVHRNNTDRLTTLKSFVTSTSNLGDSVNAAALALESNATALRNEAQTLLTTASQMKPINVDAGSLQAKASQLKTSSDSVNAMANKEVTDSLPVRQQITSNQAKESSLTSQVLAASQTVVFTQIDLTYKELQQYKQLENTSFTNAQNMLDIMQNFEAKSQEVEKNANTSLQSVAQIKTLSEESSKKASTLTSSLGPTLQAADQANSTAFQANVVGQQKTQDLAASNTKALNLRTEAQGVLNDVDTKVANITTTNNTEIIPADRECTRILSSVTAFRAQAAQATTKATTVSQNVANTNAKISELMSKIASISLLAQADIDKLKQDVAAAGTSFGEKNLKVAIETVKKGSEEQRAWLTAMAQRKALLQQKILALKAVKDQLTATP